MYKNFVVLILIFVGSQSGAAASALPELYSPDGSIRVHFQLRENFSFQFVWNGQKIFHSHPDLRLDGQAETGRQAEILLSTYREVRSAISPVVREKRAEIVNNYNEISVRISPALRLDFRVFNDAMAYRFVSEAHGNLTVREEVVDIRFYDHHSITLPFIKNFLTHYEERYETTGMNQIGPDKIIGIPSVIHLGRAGKMAVLESDLRSYPGMFLQSDQNKGLKGIFAGYPLSEHQSSDRTREVTARADYLAKTDGPRPFPWRIFAVAAKDSDLTDLDVVYRLAAPLQLQDTSWIRPGRVAWDWWNSAVLSGVDFVSGINTETYRYFCDFAASYGLEYIIMDEGWSDTKNLFRVNPDTDLNNIIRHCGAKGVGVILWMLWTTLDQQTEALEHYSRLGVKGVKVEFMQRNDQPLVDFYWKIAAEAARNKLLVNYHGSYPPAGLRRAFPNVLTRESVHGLEHNKWADTATPGHNVMLAYTRMIAGPMDYTPGAMNNAHRQNFMARFDRPMSIGTRAHQFSMYIIFESPLQMFADSPSLYMREPGFTSFLAEIPVTWDETIPLDGVFGEFLVIARRKGQRWFLGAMNNETARSLKINLDFLPRDFRSIVWIADGPNSDRIASDYTVGSGVLKGNSLSINLKKGGGFGAIISRNNTYRFSGELN